MLVAISGSQGSGKSTIIQQLKGKGYSVIERKTARSILSEWGVTLETVNTSFNLKQAFQDELLTRKYNDELEASLTDKIVFTERTYSDLFTYALISFGQYNKYDEWVNAYAQKCAEKSKIYSHVFYVKAIDDAIENDGVRSTNRFYSKLIDREMYENTRLMVKRDDLTEICSFDLEDRVAGIEHIVEKKFNK